MADLTVVTPTVEGREEFLKQNQFTVASQEGGALPHLVMVDADREGPAVIRNRLVEQVETDWVLFLDDDDWLEFDYLKTVEPFLTPDFDVVYTWCKRIGFNDNLDHPLDLEVLRRANFIPVTACVRVETFRAVGGFPSGVAYEDWGLWVRILDHGGNFHMIEDRKWTYRRHPGSRTYQNQKDVSSGRVPGR